MYTMCMNKKYDWKSNDKESSDQESNGMAIK